MSRVRFVALSMLLAGLAACGQAMNSPYEARGLAAPAEEFVILGKDGPYAESRAVSTTTGTIACIIGPQLDSSIKGGALCTQVQDKIVPLPLKHTDVKAQISLSISSVTVVQQYHNPYNGKIEAVYVFPLPEDAAIRDFVMTIGDRHIRGIIREKAEAERMYLAARAQGYRASLLSQQRDNIFTQKVANLEPGKGIDISITYFHNLKYRDGEYEFVFPMTVGPRYNPDPKVEIQYAAPSEVSTNDINLTVDLEAGHAIDKLESPSHVIKSDRPSEGRAVVTLSPNDRIPNKDFVLRYKVAGKQIRGAVAINRDEKENHFLMVIQPPESLAEFAAPAREMIFVVDCSGSMEGTPLAIAKRAAIRMLLRLAPTDTFQVMWFSDDVSVMTNRPIEATPANVELGIRYVENLRVAGGTQMIKPVQMALDTQERSRFRIVSFLTDGFIGNDREILAAVQSKVGDSRIFSFGIGSSVNRYVLEGMARLGRGAAAFIGLDESSEKSVDAFFQRLEHPAMTDVKINWGAMGVSEVYPKSIPDLFLGKPIVLIGKFSGDGKSSIRIQGRVGGQPVEMVVDVDLGGAPLRHRALGAVWARTKIAELADRSLMGGDGGECSGEIKETALKYGLMSDFTSFVAVDSSERTEGDHGTMVPVPAQVPAGMKYPTEKK